MSRLLKPGSRWRVRLEKLRAQHPDISLPALVGSFLVLHEVCHVSRRLAEPSGHGRGVR